MKKRKTDSLRLLPMLREVVRLHPRDPVVRRFASEFARQHVPRMSLQQLRSATRRCRPREIRHLGILRSRVTFHVLTGTDCKEGRRRRP